MASGTAVRRSKQRARRFKPGGPAGELEAIGPDELNERLRYEHGVRLMEPLKPLVDEPEAAADDAGPATAVVEPPRETRVDKQKYVPPPIERFESVKSPVDESKTVAASDRVQKFIRKYRKDK